MGLNKGMQVWLQELWHRGQRTQQTKIDFQGEHLKYSGDWIAPSGRSLSRKAKRNHFWPKLCGARSISLVSSPNG